MNYLNKGARLVLAALLVLALALPVMAGEAPAFKQYPNLVDAAEVKLVADGKVKGVIIDARPYKLKYLKGHIPGSISLPTSQFDKVAASKLPKDKDTLLVFYCGGLKCALSHKGAFKAHAMGYKRIQVYAKGYPDWKKHYGAGPSGPERAATPFKQFPVQVDAAAVKDVVTGKTVGLVIDSRPYMKKYAKGHIPGALSLPTSAFNKMKGLLPADKNALVIFYCGGLHCALSHKAAFKARALGYANVKVYPAGYPDWKKVYGAGAAAAMAPAKAKTAAKRSLKAGKEEGSLDLVVFEEIIKTKPEAIYLVDVRDPHEYKAGHFKSSVNIPTDDLEKKLASLPSDKPVVFTCSTGARSGEAYYMLQDQRPELKEVYYLDAEITFDDKGGYKITPPK
ncbi:MAG: hypothetical protein K9K66_05035 [Desulfarculaceae bacterium]|nr:hypothetical protein [Desulfarculaceae bacterium]MCF8072837.1 hypothetical protein [Desulfarculaceae bacterium]MCF8101005.1 hypothetical protein [Desulfarculaceae bacterium]MCF8115608.1 hypothetical protein [Desulfarculaceae bacterium]